MLIQIANTTNVSIHDITGEVSKGVSRAMETGTWEHNTFQFF